MKSVDEKPKPPFSNDTELNSLLEQYKASYAALTPEQKRSYDRELKIDWVYSQLTCTGRRPGITRELVEKLYDERHPNDSH